MNRRSVSALLAATLAAAVLASPAAAQAKKYTDIKYPKLPEFVIPKPETFELKNGMKVFLLPDRELPLVNASVLIRTGDLYEPADKVGLANLMATVERTGGTSKMTGDQIDDFLAARAASIETSMDDDVAYAQMDCLKENFREVLDVFLQVLREPAFAQDKLDVAKVQVNTGIARRNDNVGGITGREIRRLIYGPDSAMGRMTEYATVAAVTRDDLAAWHKKYYVPNRMYLGITGDFDPSVMRKTVEDAFGSMPATAPFEDAAFEYRKNANPGYFFVEKSDVNQANIVLAHPGVTVAQTLAAKEGAVADYYAIQVMNEAFGGGFASRLFSNVRSKKGLAYSVGGGLGTGFTYPGTFRTTLQTKSSTMSEAVNALKEEITAIRQNPPDDAELERAKESILNSFIFNYDSRAKILDQQMSYAYYGLPADFLEQYRANIEKVTKEDVARVANKYVKPDTLTVLVVGKAADFDKPVDSFGPVTKLDIAIPGPKDTSPKVAKTAESVAAGKQILAKVVRSLGGSSPASVNAIQSASNMELSMGAQKMALTRSVLLVFPDKLRETIKTPMGEQVTILNGGEGYMAMGAQSRPLTADMVEEKKKGLGRDLRTIVRYAEDPGLEAVAAGKETVDGVACDVVSVSFHGAESRLFVDPKGLVVKQVYQGKNPLTQVPGTLEVFYSDYREMDGRQVPHKQVIKADGNEVVTMTLETFDVNPQVDVAVFDKPAA